MNIIKRKAMSEANFPYLGYDLKKRSRSYLCNYAIDILTRSQNYYLKGRLKEDDLMDDVDNVINILKILQEKIDRTGNKEED